MVRSIRKSILTTMAKSKTELAAAASSLDQLAAEIARCRGCKLWERATQAVCGEGNPKARIMLIGEQPGDQEDLAGRPFVGPAGKLLDKALAEAGVDRKQVYVTNAVKHFSWFPRGKRRMHKTPTQQEVAACLDWLRAGAAAGQAEHHRLPGRDRGEGAARARHEGAGQSRQMAGEPWRARVMVTVHPSSILRVPAEDRAKALESFANDLARLRAK